MKFPEVLTKKRVIIPLIILLPLLVSILAIKLRRPPRKEMERFVPASALAVIRIDDLPALLDGITDLTAWRQLAPLLGISSQLNQLGFVGQLVGGTGLGPDEAVVASRAQIALAVTDIEAETGNPDGSTNIKPRVALIVETHASPDTTTRLLRDVGTVLAARVYGPSVPEHLTDYFGTPIRIFQGSEPDRQLAIASAGSVAVIANHTATVQSCLDAINGRIPNLGENGTLVQMKDIVGRDPSVFAFVTESGIEKMVRFGSAIVAARFSNDPERIGAMASLVGHLSKQTTSGFLYGSEFASNGVLERYVTLLKPQVAESLSRALPPAAAPNIEWVSFLPASFEDLTVLTVDGAGELPNRALKELAPQVDTVAALALREFVLGLQEQFGLKADETIEGALGSEVVLIRLNEGDPTAMLLRVLDRGRLEPVLNRYLTSGNSTISTDSYRGTDIALSSHPDRRGAAFAGEYLILGTRNQITTFLDIRANSEGLAKNPKFSRALASRPTGASLIGLKSNTSDAGEMMLAVARLTRVSDGAQELLQQNSIKSALEKLQPTLTITEFRNYGVYTETRSAVGSFALIGSLTGREEE
jgi:hypothetical protein